MSHPHRILAVLASALAVASLSSAASATNYMQCMANRAKLGPCADKICGYQACIENRSGSVGGARDAGDWGSAMAACYPFITAIEQCSNRIVEEGNASRRNESPIGPALGGSGSYTWVPGGVADPCEFHDTSSSLGSAVPESAKCNPATVGTFAVCWDKSTRDYYNPGRVWCTYKDARCQMGHGGRSKGQMYTCTRN